MSNLSLSSVDFWRIILAQNQILNFVDLISNTRSAWATTARGRSPINSTTVSSILRISFLKHLMTTFVYCWTCWCIYYWNWPTR